MKKRLFLITIVVAFAGLIAGLSNTGLIPSDVVTERKAEATSSRNTSNYVRGTMNGFQIRIPKSYLRYPVEYEGESPWEHSGSKRGSDSGPDGHEVANFTLYLEWPALEPHLRENDDSFQASLQSFAPDNWLRIGVTARGKGSIPEVDVNGMNSLARIGSRIIEDPHDDLPMGVAYKVSEDGPHGLNRAQLVGPSSDGAAVWNRTVFWSGDKDKVVASLIVCGAGKLSTRPGYMIVDIGFE